MFQALDEILYMHDLLCEKHIMQPGTRAVLIVTPEIDKDSGWRGSMHFLKAGRQGTIVSYYQHLGQLLYLFRPDNQTWFSSTDGKEHPVTQPACYVFSSSSLEKLRP
jgi:hypothetical protein